MNTGQTMLTIGALAMLSVILMNYYGSIGQTGRTLSKIGAGFTATTIATSMLEEIENCAFDPCTDTASTAEDSTKFTKPNLFTIAAGHTKDDWKHFLDINEFNNDTISITPGYMNEVYTVAVQVYYVNPYGDIGIKLNKATDKQTYVKRVDVKVWRSVPPLDVGDKFDTVNVSSLHGYFYFNPI
jgi:hypothetical protein